MPFIVINGERNFKTIIIFAKNDVVVNHYYL